MELDRVPIWQGDDVSTQTLWSYFAEYLYLPRLRDQGTFAYSLAALVVHRCHEFGDVGRRDLVDPRRPEEPEPTSTCDVRHRSDISARVGSTFNDSLSARLEAHASPRVHRQPSGNV